MSIRRSSVASIVNVEHRGLVIGVQVALNQDGDPRAILGKCSTTGRKHYFVWAACAMNSTKTHLTCRITGWKEDGTQQKPPQGTSVRMSDIQLDTCFDGLQHAEVVLVVEKAIRIYISKTRAPSEFDIAQPSNTSLRKLEIPTMPVPGSSTIQHPSYLSLKEELNGLRRRVTYLEKERELEGMFTPVRPWVLNSPIAPPTPTTPITRPSVAMPSPNQNHFMLTVLRNPENP